MRPASAAHFSRQHLRPLTCPLPSLSCPVLLLPLLQIKFKLPVVIKGIILLEGRHPPPAPHQQLIRCWALDLTAANGARFGPLYCEKSLTCIPGHKAQVRLTDVSGGAAAGCSCAASKLHTAGYPAPSSAPVCNNQSPSALLAMHCGMRLWGLSVAPSPTCLVPHQDKRMGPWSCPTSGAPSCTLCMLPGVYPPP